MKFSHLETTNFEHIFAVSKEISNNDGRYYFDIIFNSGQIITFSYTDHFECQAEQLACNARLHNYINMKKKFYRKHIDEQ